MVFCLVGRRKDSDAKDGLFTQDLCWTGLQLYSLERILSQVRYKIKNLLIMMYCFLLYLILLFSLLLASKFQL